MNILIINGPNLNMLGKRENEHYGSLKLEDIYLRLEELAKVLGVKVNFFQSNSEGEIIDVIQRSYDYDGLIVNLGGYTHTSIAIRDALLALNKPFIEVHLSNVFKRESFRHNSFVSDIAIGVIAGFREESYYLALQAITNYLKSHNN